MTREKLTARSLRLLATALVTFFAMLALAPIADARRVTERVASGPTEVEFSYDVRGAFPQFSDLRVRIEREDEKLINQRVPGCPAGCGPAGRNADQRSVRLRDVDDDGEPEVLVDVFTGGANCCSVSLLYAFRNAGDSYRRTIANWGRGGYLLRDFDGDRILEFGARDRRFDYRFSCTACNSSPPRTWHFVGGRLRDVTRRFPGRITRDLRRVRRLYLRNRRSGAFATKGILPAYAADQCLLNHCGRGFRVLERAARRGEFRSEGFNYGPTGRAFVRAVKRFLKRAGYVR